MLKKLQMFSLATALALAPTMTLGAYTTVKNGITWYYEPLPYGQNGHDLAELSNGSSAVISTSTAGAVVIPSSLGSYSVTYYVKGLGNYAFEDCTKLTSVTIPFGVTYIGNYVFSGCTGLSSVAIPSSVTSIGGSAFCGCTGLSTVTIPSSVTSIGGRTFYGCTGLTSVTIPPGVTSIGDYAFKGCAKMTSVTIPSSVTSIGYGAFEGCTGLKSVTICEGVTSIGDYAFLGCTGLTSVTIPSSVTSIGDDAFDECKGLTSVTIRDGVKSIGDGAFFNCTGLTSVTIPSSVTSIGSYAFSRCPGLGEGMVIVDGWLLNVKGECPAEVVVPDGVRIIAGSVFSGRTGLMSVSIPSSVTSIGEYAFEGCTGLTSVTIPSSVTDIGYEAFKGCTGLTSVTVPGRNCGINFSTVTNLVITDGTVSIGDYAFQGCRMLTSVTIPSGVTSIGDNAFRDCTGLTSVTIPSGVTSVGDHAFRDCTGLTSVTIPSGMTSIGDYAFNGCTVLTSVTIPSSVTSIGDYAFESCTGLFSVTIPEGVKSIGYHAFYGCTGLTSATIPSSVTSIGKYAFEYCTGLTSVTIRDGVKSIGDGVFFNCTGLASVTIPSSVTSIGGNTFRGCTGMKAIVVDANNASYKTIDDVLLSKDGARLIACPSGKKGTYTILPSVTSIGDSAFYGCAGLISVTIPEGVKSIGDWAFCGCTGLTSVTIRDGVKSIGYCAFYGCAGLTSVTIPSGVTSIGRDAFSGCTGLKAIVVDANNASYKTIDGVLLSKDGSRLIACPSGKEGAYTILPSVTSFGDRAFYGCAGLTSVTIPEGVMSIGDSAFCGCTGLTSVTIPSGVTSIGSHAFSGCAGLTSVTIPLSLSATSSIGSDAFYGCDGLTSVTVPGWKCRIDFSNITNLVISDGTKIIQDYAFENCMGLTSVTIPSSVTRIGDSAFEGCTGLKSVTIPSSVTRIGDSAFKGCTGLKSVTIPSSVTRIAASAFEDCTGLTSLTISSSLTGGCGADAFKGCKGLRSVTLPGKNCGIDFSNITNLVISDRTVEIGSYAFTDCTMLKSLAIPAGVKRIGERAFKGCSGLTSLTIPSSVTSFGDDAFKGCTTLTSVTVPGWQCGLYFSKVTELVISDGTVNIVDCAFEACTKLKSLVIPASVTCIGREAFKGCSGLTSLTIPSNVTNICYKAFEGCSGLKTITFMGNAPTVGVVAFAACNADCTAYVRPDSTGWGVTIPGTWQGIGIEYSALPPDSGLQTETVDGVSWSFTVANGNACISAGSYSGDLSVPSALGGHPVTGVGNAAFGDCAGLTRLVIPASVTKIGNNAFTGCSGLTNIVFEGNAPEIGDEAFSDCNEGCTLYVKCGSTGWGEEWNGRTIEYQPDSHLAVVTKTARAATCTEVGWTEEVSCSRCGSVLTSSRSIAALGHNSYVSKAAQAATCTDAGWTEEVSCSRCGSVLTSSLTIAALGHDSYVSTKAQAATCTDAGWTEEVSCSRCGSVLTSSLTIAALGHNSYVSKNAKSATCTDAGWTEEVSCSRCGSVLTASLTIAALGHNSYVSKAAQAATCTDAGWTEEVSCSRCGSVLTASRMIVALGHNSYVSKDAQAATCTDAGWTEEVSCSRCGSVLTVSRTISALGHNSYVSKAAQAATYSAAGWTEERKCSRCGIVLQASVEIPKLTPDPEPDPEPVCSYTVTYHANGGTGGTTLTYSSGATLGTLPTATRTGYTFMGWYTAASGGTEVVSTTVVTEDVTYYAHWSQVDLGTVVGSGLTFTTGGDADWFAQTAMTHDGRDAAQSGIIFAGQTSWMQTVVTGSCTVSFWWCVSSERGFDQLKFFVDDVERASISGTEVGWSQYSIDLTGTGSHALKWQYSKDGSADNGDDCGWVDQVVLSAVLNVLPDGNNYTEEVDGYTWTFSIANGEAEIGIRDEYGNRQSQRAVEPSPTGALAVPATLGGCPVKRLGDGALVQCSDMTSVSLPDSLVEIGDDAFGWCKQLSDITLPDALVEIGDYAFDCCYQLTELAIPASVTNIGERMLCNCSELRNLTVAADNPYFSSDDGVLYDKEKTDLYFWPQAKKIELPSTLRNVRAYACFGNYATQDETLVFPSGVTNIANEAFMSCNLAAISLNEGVRAIGPNAFAKNQQLHSVEIPSTVEVLGVGEGWRGAVFWRCFDLTSVFFRGNAPKDVGENLYGDTSEDLVTYVRKGSRGWSSEDSTTLPATWPAVDEDGNGAPRAIAFWEEETTPTYGPWGEAEGIENPDKLAPVFFADVSLAIDGEAAAIGDCVAVYRGDTDALCGLGKVQTVPGALSIICYAPYGVELTFKVWTASSGLDDPLILACGKTSAPASGEIVNETLLLAASTLPTDRKISYTVVFNANGGTGSMADQSMTHGTATALIKNAFHRANYIFVGWSTTPAATSAMYADGQMVADLSSQADATVNLYAVWRMPLQVSSISARQRYPWNGLVDIDVTFSAAGLSAISFVVTDTNGGTNLNAKTFYLGNPEDNVRTLEAQPGAHRFVWDAAADLGQVVLPSFVVTAMVREKLFDVNVTGGTGSGTYVQGSSVALTADVKTGYTFAYWKGSATNLLANAAAASTTLVLPAFDVAYEAIYTPNVYTVVFNANGGTGTMADESFTYGTKKALTANAFTRNAFVFQGWADSATATEAQYTDSQNVKNLATAGTKTLYAVWKHN